MIFLQNDFYSNFTNAAASQDEKSVESMLVDQMSTLVASEQKKIVNLLNELKIPISKPVNKATINAALAKGLVTNSQLKFGIAYLIAEKNGIITEKKSEKTMKVVSNITGSINSLIEKFRENPSRLSGFEAELNAQTKVKAPDAYKNIKTKKQKAGKKNDWVVPVLVVAGLGLATYLIVRHVKNSKATPKLEGGGEAVKSAESAATTVASTTPPVADAAAQAVTPPVASAAEAVTPPVA